MAKQTFTTGQVLTAAQMTTLQANDYNQTVSAKTASYVLVAADAGTRITMSNAGATTITVNTGLFTAGDTLIITNIGAGACTITAGTATVSSAGSLTLNQYDSGTLYFSSASAAIWNGANPGDITGVTAGTGISGGGTSGTVTITNSMATEITAAGDIIVGTGSGTFDNLPIGTTAQVLTADTTVSPYKVKWATPASGGGMTLLSTTNTTTGSSYTVSSISSDYINLLVMWNGACTAGASLTISFAGGNSSGGGINQDGTAVNWTATNAKLMPDTQGAGNIVSCLITNYKESAEKTLQIAFGGVNTGWRGGATGGFLSYTSAISTFTITLSTGSFSSGSLRVFGVK